MDPINKKYRRAADPEALISNSAKVRELLGWNVLFVDLDTMVSSALKWHRTNGDNI